MAKMTLAQIASEYNRCTKTFLKYVDKLGIPHVKLGRDRLFDAAEVDAFLRKLNEPVVRPDLSAKKVARKPQTSSAQRARYEEMLGLR